MNQTLENDDDKNEHQDPFSSLGLDTHQNLLKSRIILLNGDVKENIIERAAIPLIKFTDGNKAQKPVQILLNSYGGNMEDAQAVIDIIRTTKTHIVTKVLGKAMSAAFDIFLAGDKRIIYPNSILMCHAGGTAMAYKPLPYYNDEAKLFSQLYDRWATFYASRTNISKKEWLDIITSGKDHYFQAEEALAKGLAHEIYKYAKK